MSKRHPVHECLWLTHLDLVYVEILSFSKGKRWIRLLLWLTHHLCHHSLFNHLFDCLFDFFWQSPARIDRLLVGVDLLPRNWLIIGVAVLLPSDLLQNFPVDQRCSKCPVLFHLSVGFRSFEVLVVTDHVKVAIRIFVTKLVISKINFVRLHVVKQFRKGLLKVLAIGELRKFEWSGVVGVYLSLFKGFLGALTELLHVAREAKLSNFSLEAYADVHFIY